MSNMPSYSPLLIFPPPNPPHNPVLEKHYELYKVAYLSKAYWLLIVTKVMSHTKAVSQHEAQQINADQCYRSSSGRQPKHCF